MFLFLPPLKHGLPQDSPLGSNFFHTHSLSYIFFGCVSRLVPHLHPLWNLLLFLPKVPGIVTLHGLDTGHHLHSPLHYCTLHKTQPPDHSHLVQKSLTSLSHVQDHCQPKTNPPSPIQAMASHLIYSLLPVAIISQIS